MDACNEFSVWLLFCEFKVKFSFLPFIFFLYSDPPDAHINILINIFYNEAYAGLLSSVFIICLLRLSQVVLGNTLFKLSRTPALITLNFKLKFDKTTQLSWKQLPPNYRLAYIFVTFQTMYKLVARARSTRLTQKEVFTSFANKSAWQYPLWQIFLATFTRPK